MNMEGTLTSKNFRKSNKANNRGTRMRQTKLMLCVKAKKFGDAKIIAKPVPVVEFLPENREVSGNVVHVLDTCVKAFAEVVNDNDGETKGDGRDTSTKIEQFDGSIQEINSSFTKYQSSSFPSKHESVSRPKRNLSQKKPVETCGLSWKEENDLKRALYASLQRKKIKLGFQDEIDVSSELNAKHLDESSCSRGIQRNDLLANEMSCNGTSADHQNRKLKCSLGNGVPTNHLFKAQRKFALGMRPIEEGLSKRRRFQKKVDCSLEKDDVIPYTEDFINYLCFRGASYFPEGLRYFENVLNKSYSTGNETQLDTPSSCTSTDFLPDIQRGTRKIKRKVQVKTCPVRVKKRIEVERIKRLKVIRKQQSQRQKFVPKQSPLNNLRTSKTSGNSCLATSSISLRSGKIISTIEVGKVERDESPGVSLFANSLIKNQESSDITGKSQLRKLKVKGHLNSSQIRRNVYSRRLKRDGGSKKRRRRGIELIDKSWCRSGLRKYVEKPEEIKQVRPITRSRTLAAIEDELNRAKLEVDANNNQDDAMQSFS